MRVVEPDQFKSLKKTKKTKVTKHVIALTAVAAILGGSGYGFAAWKQSSYNVEEKNKEITGNSPEPSQETVDKSLNYKYFTGDEFKTLFLTISYPNTQQIADPPPITGDKDSDERIRRVAEARGYRLSVIPVAPILMVDEPKLDNDNLLQPLAAHGWSSLKDAAIKDNIPISLTSAYRSPEYQRQLFMYRLRQSGITNQQIKDGRADHIINRVLTLAAIPGYSRHHTGYTIDLWCEDGSITFLNSICFSWISENNYLKAKESGWIPSYPDGAELQGPEPEPWEYVWVGQKSLLE